MVAAIRAVRVFCCLVFCFLRSLCRALVPPTYLCNSSKWSWFQIAVPSTNPERNYISNSPGRSPNLPMEIATVRGRLRPIIRVFVALALTCALPILSIAEPPTHVPQERVIEFCDATLKVPLAYRSNRATAQYRGMIERGSEGHRKGCAESE